MWTYCASPTGQQGGGGDEGPTYVEVHIGHHSLNSRGRGRATYGPTLHPALETWASGSLNSGGRGLPWMTHFTLPEAVEVAESQSPAPVPKPVCTPSTSSGLLDVPRPPSCALRSRCVASSGGGSIRGLGGSTPGTSSRYSGSIDCQLPPLFCSSQGGPPPGGVLLERTERHRAVRVLERTGASLAL